MAATSGDLLFLVWLGAIALIFLTGIVQQLYRRYQLWKFISQEEELPDPLEMLYEFRLKKVEDSESGGENL